MYTTALPSRILRVDKRYRHWTTDLTTERETAREKEDGEEEDRRPGERTAMGRPHALFHRRQAPNILTLGVEVINSLDSSGNIIAQQTVTPDANSVKAAPAHETVPIVPTVPAVPTNAVPTVPAVPPFPSDLTVPGYPFTSGSTAPASSSQASITLSPSSAALTTALPSSAFNSTFTSSLALSTASLSSINTSSESSASSSQSSTESSSSQTSTLASTSQTSSSASLVATSSAEGGFGGGVNPATPAPTASSPSGVAGAASEKSPPLGTPEVVGTVFGTLAGAALLLALVLFLLRRHKKKKQAGALQLTGDDNADNQPMTQTAARRSYVAPSFLNRFSGASKSTVETTSTGERGFQRISGRKLPSAFSEGLTSEQFAKGEPRGEGTLSGSSFYKDDKGIYGGPGVIPKDFAFAKETGEPANVGAIGTKERVMPSPARTPVLHHPDPFADTATLSPPLTPNPDYPPPRGTLGRSLPSRDGSRSSRFTENV